MRSPKKTFSVLLPLELYVFLHQHAIADNRTMSAELRQILRGYMEYMAQGGISWCRGSKNRGILQFEPSPCQGEDGRAKRDRMGVAFE